MMVWWFFILGVVTGYVLGQFVIVLVELLREGE